MRTLRRSLCASAFAIGISVPLLPPQLAHADPSPTPRAAETPAVQETQILAQWLKNSPEVASWRTQVGSARFDAVTAGLWANPELLVLGNFLLDGAPPDGVYNYQAQLTIPLPIFGQVRARVDAANRATSVAETNVLQTVWSRAADIDAAMVARAFADARIAMLARNLEELDRIRGIVNLRAGAGANSEYDVLRVDAAAGTLRASIANAHVDRDRAESNLLALIADSQVTSANITREGLASFRGPEEIEPLIALALQRRPDLELARRGVRASDANAARFRRDAIPTPSLVVGGYLSEKLYGFQVTGGISIPLPVADRNQGQIGRALSERQGQELMVKALETRVRAEVTGSWQARKNARLALAQYRGGSIAAATALLKRAEVTYQAGRFSITELFDAYQTMWDARSQELDIERQGADAEADLERAAVLLPILDGPR